MNKLDIIKKGTLSSLLLGVALSVPAHASPETCGFKDVEGTLIEFTASDKPKKGDPISSQLPVYRYFTSDFSNETPLKKEVYVGRRAKFEFSKPIERGNGEMLAYSGYADNCQHIWLHVEKSNFSQYFNPHSVTDSEVMNFLAEESYLGIFLVDSSAYNVNKSSHVNGTFFVKSWPSQDIYFTDTMYESTTLLKPFTEVKVGDIQHISFSINGKVISDYRMEAYVDGKKGYINLSRGALSTYNPLNDVPEKFEKAIRANKIQDGMTFSSIVMSLGNPTESASFPVYNTGRGHVVDYNDELKQYDYEIVGHALMLRYDHIPYPINLDMSGKFWLEDQVFFLPQNRGKLDFMYNF